MFQKSYSWLTIALSIMILFSCSDNMTDNPAAIEKSTNKYQYIVVLNDSPGIQSAGQKDNSAAVGQLLGSYNIPLTNVSAYYNYVLNGFCVELNGSQLAALQNDSRVQTVEKDQEYSLNGEIETLAGNDPRILTQTTPWGITAVGGSTDAASNTGVAWIVDTGIDFTHPDLNVDTARSRSFVRYGNDALTANDMHGHGSHVAGIIGAKNNTIGVVGVCAGATVIAVKAFNYLGSGTVSQIISGLDYIRRNLFTDRINVVNMSLGGSASTTLDAAVRNLADAGAYIVIAAGNSRANANNYSPARVNGTRIYTVSAHSSTGVFASFSNYGNAPIDFSAPGVSIYSTYKNNGYTTMSGTSMATPHVVGILLADNGSINTNGNVTSDPDSVADTKARK